MVNAKTHSHDEPIVFMTNSHATIISLYRTYIRRIRQLPLPYLRQFFRVKVADDIHAIIRAKDDNLRNHKLKRVSQDFRKIEAAINGNTKAFAHVLDLAYGRKGKLKWELMKPLFSDPNAPIPPRIIPAVEKSRPPVYSPELKALLTSNLSRKNKPLTPKSFSFPPTLPLRADPNSEDARLLGPFSKRREVNIRWRYFTSEWKKIRPPLEIVLEDTSTGEVLRGNADADVARAGIRGLSMQGQGVFDDIEAIVNPLSGPRPPTRKERRNSDADTQPPQTAALRHPSRWLRRRYQELLGRLPILTYSQFTAKGGNISGRYSVSLSPNALTPLRLFLPQVAEVATVEDQCWLKLAQEKEGIKSAERNP
ncbi:hypothetical protein Hypma_015714 [Hypsizygus marmoreus]|uniref:LYR motif-containing protein Cup1-like N-terminal domain-containing protein n=1 Tax=Hypsizygus marmoreus TaxID=39966 RepID=A0A369K2M4_HYPMA|nr:hypothetical protein Hypma_015714 [Hypsizygus marmoreus]